MKGETQKHLKTNHHAQYVPASLYSVYQQLKPTKTIGIYMNKTRK